MSSQVIRRPELRGAIAGALLALGCTLLSGSTGQVSPGGLGGSFSSVAACDDDVGVTWATGSSPTFSPSPTVADTTWELSSVRLTGVDAACDGRSFELAVVDGSDTPLATTDGTLTVIGGQADIAFAAVDAQQVARTIVVVHG